MSSTSLVVGLINKNLLTNLVALHTPACEEVRAAIAYADKSNLDLLESCKKLDKPLTYYGRYDQGVPVHPEVIRWFLNQKNPNYICRVVPDILHAKVIWWVGVGAYIGSANMTNRAWISNIEAGIFLSEDSSENDSVFEDLKVFFDVVETKSHPIDDAFYRHLLDLSKRSASIDAARHKLQQDAPRLFPKLDGLVSAPIEY
jgi:phosphatidylserine/phosphatidylglycerophosphate/cardiolipin synthase-like enzyme